MTKRSPRYPRQSLSTSLEMVRKIFNGVHQAPVDADTAAKLIGYSNSRSGAAAGALGALRQFALLDGLRGEVAVSDLSMRIIQPMDEQERVAALHEAAGKPEMFGRIIHQFGGRLPAADEPIRAFLIRQEGFSSSGSNELIKTLRETMGALPETPTEGATEAEAQAEFSPGDPSTDRNETGTSQFHQAPSLSGLPKEGELVTLPLGQNSRAELRLVGKVTAKTYERLIRHLELLKDMAAEEG